MVPGTEVRTISAPNPFEAEDTCWNDIGVEISSVCIDGQGLARRGIGGGIMGSLNGSFSSLSFSFAFTFLELFFSSLLPK